MSVLSMPVLPDCARKDCGGQVVLRIGSHEQAMEECVKCGAAYWPEPPVGWLQELKRRCRVVVEMDRRGEL